MNAGCPPSSLSLPLLPSPGTPGLGLWGSPHTRVPGAHKEPAPCPCILFWVSQAAATRTSGASGASCGFGQEQVCETGQERVCCPPSFHVVPLGGPEAHAVPWPVVSGCAHHISVWRLRHRDSGGGDSGAQVLLRGQRSAETCPSTPDAYALITGQA